MDPVDASLKLFGLFIVAATHIVCFLLRVRRKVQIFTFVYWWPKLLQSQLQETHIKIQRNIKTAR